jgi:AcrR family transcriptional regulator
VGDIKSRREEQKARTRARVRALAQDLFAEHGFDAVTLIQIAATAQVSVQTVFNHFASKEELFFDERSEWVEGAAAAVRGRACGEAPTEALHRHLLGSVEGFARAQAEPRHRRMVEVLDGTPTLLAYERLLHDESVGRLAEALAEATDPSRLLLARVTAATWMAVVREMVIDLRSEPPAAGDADEIRDRLVTLDRLLTELGRAVPLPGAAARRVA